MTGSSNITKAEVVLPCADVQETASFLTGHFGFRLDAIHPADDPRVAVVSGHGVCLRLDRRASGPPGTLRLVCRDVAAVAGGATEVVAPNGTRIELVPHATTLSLPALRPSFVLSRAAEARWVEGRAGMRYRDLIPDRQGGRFIASLIQIPAGGPVEDYVHYHEVQFQLIYCAQGWAQLAYEDQGAPFALQAGDCVLQPPRIRHRVLGSSPGLEVIEISAPAAHETFADHDLALPTPTLNRGRAFSGQCFHWHEAAHARWRPAGGGGFESRDLGLAGASRGVVGGEVLRARGGDAALPMTHGADLRFAFVLKGGATLACAERSDVTVGAGDAFVVPAGIAHSLNGCTHDLELFLVTSPRAP